MRKTLLYLLCTVWVAMSEATPTAGKDVGCGSEGALACDADGSHVATCTRGGAWQRVRDCAASHEVCANGRCVTGVEERAVSCGGSKGYECSSDCLFVTLCSVSGIWIIVNKCPAGTLCVEGECKSDAEYTCGANISTSAVCGTSAAGATFPNLEDCSSYLSCEEDWAAPKVKYCASGYYDPCSGTCSLKSPAPCRHYERCVSSNEGLDIAVLENPSLHYTCAEGKIVLKKCEIGYYDATSGECVGDGVVCRTC